MNSLLRLVGSCPTPRRRLLFGYSNKIGGLVAAIAYLLGGIMLLNNALWNSLYLRSFHSLVYGYSQRERHDILVDQVGLHDHEYLTLICIEYTAGLLLLLGGALLLVGIRRLSVTLLYLGVALSCLACSLGVVAFGIVVRETQRVISAREANTLQVAIVIPIVIAVIVWLLLVTLAYSKEMSPLATRYAQMPLPRHRSSNGVSDASTQQFAMSSTPSNGVHSHMDCSVSR